MKLLLLNLVELLNSSPLFGEWLVLPLESIYTVVCILVLDHKTRQCLALYKLPLNPFHLPPYRQVSLTLHSLTSVRHGMTSPTCHISLMYTDGEVTESVHLDRFYHSRMLFLECVYQGVQKCYKSISTDITCVAIIRVVTSGSEYQSHMQRMDSGLRGDLPLEVPLVTPQFKLQFDANGNLLHEALWAKTYSVKQVLMPYNDRLTYSQVPSHYSTTLAANLKHIPHHHFVLSLPVVSGTAFFFSFSSSLTLFNQG
jgi:hypothetical protein